MSTNKQLEDIELNTAAIADEFVELNKNLRKVAYLLDKVLELNAEKLLNSLWNALEKVIEEHP